MALPVDFKGIKEYFIFVYPAIVVLGVIYNFTYYYGYFGFKIFEFSGIPDLLVPSTPALVTLCLYFLLGFISNVLLIGEESRKKRHQREIAAFEEPNPIIRQWLHLKALTAPIYYFYAFCIVALLIGVPTGLMETDTPTGAGTALNTIVVTECLTIIGAFFIITEQKRKYYLTNQELPKESTMRLIVGSIFMVFATIFFAAIKGNNVKVSKLYMQSSFRMGDSLVQSDSFRYYIGNTSNYVFFYNEPTEITHVYPMGRVDELQLVKEPF